MIEEVAEKLTLLVDAFSWDITIKNNKAEISSKLAFIVSESVNTSLSVLAKNINSVK